MLTETSAALQQLAMEHRDFFVSRITGLIIWVQVEKKKNHQNCLPLSNKILEWIVDSIPQILVCDWNFHQANKLNQAANNSERGFAFLSKIGFSFL